MHFILLVHTIINEFIYIDSYLLNRTHKYKFTNKFFGDAMAVARTEKWRALMKT